LGLGRALSGSPRRIGLLGPLAPWRGGLAQYLALLGEALMPDAEVRGITFTRQYPGIFFPGKSQFDPAAGKPAFPVESLLDSIGPWSWRRTAAALEAFAPGAVILKWWMPFFAPAFASSVAPLRRRGTRVVLVCDNLVPHEKRFFDRAFTAWMLRESDGFLVMSESVERDLLRLKPHAAFRRVPHPLYAQFDRGRWTRESARQHLGLAPDAEVALFFGYVRRYKGLDVLLEAWRQVRARRPATLIVAGDFYEDPAPYRALATAAGDGAVRMMEGYRTDEEVEALFKASDVAVLPYRSGTQSGVTHVAFALGVPVITTDAGGISEIVTVGRNGLVVPASNGEALAREIIRFFEQGLGPRMRAAVDEVKRTHSWDVLAARTLELVDALRPARGWS
jgi:glycosyltransferase involved in cell wall biosynthesis